MRRKLNISDASRGVPSSLIAKEMPWRSRSVIGFVGERGRGARSWIGLFGWDVFSKRLKNNDIR